MLRATWLLDAFSQARDRIEAICAQALERNGGKPVILHSGVVRMLLAADRSGGAADWPITGA
ncbi:hypothetical protein WJ542_29705 [Paraburkholderia sp. B3]|uniref:hypothetical protein n=1 Tax=Paraburkholderia sp. B3 TaxID=3134791 RepID=UPI0039829CA6